MLQLSVLGDNRNSWLPPIPCTCYSFQTLHGQGWWPLLSLFVLMKRFACVPRQWKISSLVKWDPWGRNCRHVSYVHIFQLSFHLAIFDFHVLNFLEMRCYRKILYISYKDYVTNEEVRAKIQLTIGPHEDCLTIVNRHKVQWYDHVSHSSGLAKSIWQGTVKGGRRQGRQRKRWEDNIKALMDRRGVHQVPEGSGEQGKNGGNRLWNHLWCPNDPRSQGIDEMMREYISSVVTVSLSPDDTG